MKVLDAIKKIFDKILEVLGIICLTIMTIMIVYQVIARYVFNNPSAVSEALAQFLFVWMIMFGSAYVYGSKEHLTIDILKDKFPPKMNLVVNILTNICLFLFVMLICSRAVTVIPSARSSRSMRRCTFPSRSCMRPYRSPVSSRCIMRCTTPFMTSSIIKRVNASSAILLAEPHEKRR